MKNDSSMLLRRWSDAAGLYVGHFQLRVCALFVLFLVISTTTRRHKVNRVQSPEISLDKSTVTGFVCIIFKYHSALSLPSKLTAHIGVTDEALLGLI